MNAALVLFCRLSDIGKANSLMILGIFRSFAFFWKRKLFRYRIFKNQAEKTALVLDPNMNPGSRKSGLFQRFQSIVQGIGKNCADIYGLKDSLWRNLSVGCNGKSFFSGNAGFFPSEGICQRIPKRYLSGLFGQTGVQLFKVSFQFFFFSSGKKVLDTKQVIFHVMADTANHILLLLAGLEIAKL